MDDEGFGFLESGLDYENGLSYIWIKQRVQNIPKREAAPVSYFTNIRHIIACPSRRIRSRSLAANAGAAGHSAIIRNRFIMRKQSFDIRKNLVTAGFAAFGIWFIVIRRPLRHTEDTRKVKRLHW